MSNNNNIIFKINEEIKKYEILKKSFLRMCQAEDNANEKNKNIFQLFENLNFQNDILRNNYNELVNNIRDLENDKIKIYKKEIKDLILEVSNYYPQKLKNLKDEITRIAGQNREIEDKLDKFEKERINDNKYLFLHFLYSELDYHSKAIEKMSKIFTDGKDFDPREKLEEFNKEIGINVDYNKFFDIEEIMKNKKEREKKKIKERKKEEDDITNTYSKSESSDFINNNK